MENMFCISFNHLTKILEIGIPQMLQRTSMQVCNLVVAIGAFNQNIGGWNTFGYQYVFALLLRHRMHMHFGTNTLGNLGCFRVLQTWVECLMEQDL